MKDFYWICLIRNENWTVFLYASFFLFVISDMYTRCHNQQYLVYFGLSCLYSMKHDAVYVIVWLLNLQLNKNKLQMLGSEIKTTGPYSRVVSINRWSQIYRQCSQVWWLCINYICTGTICFIVSLTLVQHIITYIDYDCNLSCIIYSLVVNASWWHLNMS